MEARPQFGYDILAATAEILPVRDVQDLTRLLERPEERALILVKWVIPVVDVGARAPMVDDALAVAAGDRWAARMLLGELVPFLTADQVDRAREEIGEFSAGNRIELLLALSARLPIVARRSCLDEALDIVASLSGDEWLSKQRQLSTLAPHLPASMLLRAVSASEAIRDVGSQAGFLISVAERLDGAQQRIVVQRALSLLERVDYETWVELSTALIPILPPSVRRGVAAIAAKRVLGDLQSKPLTLFTLAVSTLTPADRTPLLKKAWTSVVSEENPEARSVGAIRLLRHLRDRNQAGTLALASAARIADPNRRVPIMREAFHAVLPGMLPSALAAARAEPEEWARLQLFAEIGHNAPREVEREAEQALQASNRLGAAVMLAGIWRCFKGPARDRIRGQLLAAVEDLEGFDLVALLSQIGSSLDRSLGMHAFARTAWISNRAGRAEAQSALVSHLPEPARAGAIRDILELLQSATSGQQSAVVHRLAPHAPAEAAADCLAFFIEA